MKQQKAMLIALIVICLTVIVTALVTRKDLCEVRIRTGQTEVAVFTAYEPSLFRILCKCLFSEVTVQAVTELDNKAAHCHSPVLQRHRPFLGRRLDCQPHHFFHRVVCREHFTLFDRMADHAV